NDRNVLLDGLSVSGPATSFQVTLTESMSAVRGRVTDSGGSPVQGAFVVLMPEDSSQTHLYANAVTDWKGFFELPCVHTGSYHLYSWLELNGAAYRNAEFMKKYEGAGLPVRVEDQMDLKVDTLSPLDAGDTPSR